MTRRNFLGTTLAAVGGAPLITRAAATDGFTFGLAADAQYANVDPQGTRFYRQGLPRLAAAVEHFNSRAVAFAVHLGDLIDREWRSFDDIVPVLSPSRPRWHQLLGNHDFEVLDEYKARVPQRLGMKWRHGFFDHGAFRFVVLDTNDVSTYAHAAGTAEHAAAQLAWFDRVCREARAGAKKVLVLAHHPVFPANGHNLWNASEVLAVVDRHPHIVAWFNGHNHAGAFGERHGVPFLTLHGMVETADTSAFAIAQVLADRIVLTGHGREPSRELVFRPQ